MAHWTLAYLAGAWLILQMMDVLTDIWPWPLSLQRGICLALALGVFPALVISWFHGEKGRQRISTVEVLVVGALLIGAGGIVWVVCAG